MLYHEDVPDDVSIVAQSPAEGMIPGGEVTHEEVVDGGRAGAVRHRLLRSVPADADPAEATMASALAAAPVRRRRRPQLRLVK